MRTRLFPLSLLLSLAACAAAHPKTAAPDTSARFTYRAALASVPEGANAVRLGVRVPDKGPAGELRALSAFGLVGNAPFELALSGDDVHAPANAPVRASWKRVGGKDGAARELVLETHGRPIELGLRIAAPADAALDAHALEALLAPATWAEIDAQPAPAVTTRCERVR